MKRILGLKQYVDSLEQMNRQMSEQVESYHQSQAVPPPESEASLVVQTIDHKGVIMRHPADRSTIADHDPQSEPRQDRKRMAAVAGVYTVEPYVRTPEQVLEALFAPPGQRRSEEPPRPRPQHKRLRACLSHVDSQGDEINGTAAMFGWLAEETQARNPQGLKTLIHITDGEPQLRTGCDVFQADVPMVAILDLLHATSRVWAMSRLFCGDEASRTAFVKERVRLDSARGGDLRGAESAQSGDATKVQGKTSRGSRQGLRVLREQRGSDALRRILGEGLSHSQRCDRGRLPARGEGPYGANREPGAAASGRSLLRPGSAAVRRANESSEPAELRSLRFPATPTIAAAGIGNRQSRATG